MELDPDQKAANQSDNVLVQAVLGGAACGLLWGALALFVLFREEGGRAVLLALFPLSTMSVAIQVCWPFSAFARSQVGDEWNHLAPPFSSRRAEKV
jgi:hypothetical protein